MAFSFLIEVVNKNSKVNEWSKTKQKQLNQRKNSTFPVKL